MPLILHFLWLGCTGLRLWNTIRHACERDRLCAGMTRVSKRAALLSTSSGSGGSA